MNKVMSKRRCIILAISHHKHVILYVFLFLYIFVVLLCQNAFLITHFSQLLTVNKV